MHDQDRSPVEERRFPGINNPCKYTLDRIRDEVIKFSKKIPDNSTLLDFGCGDKPYEDFFKEKVREYISLDIADSPEKNPGVSTVIKQGDRIPFEDGYFDAIISTQVFEHIRDPVFYGTEFNRILKEGGNAFISSAFAWEYHPYPNDYWRISEDGYRVIFRDFSEIRFDVDTNSLQTIIQSLNSIMARRKIQLSLPYNLVNFVIGRIDHRKGDRNFPGNLFVYLKK